MGIGLTFDEYVDVKLRPPAGADRAIQRAAEQERDAMFPMTTAAASSHLRSRGYDCRPAMLDVLVKNGIVTLAQPDVWTQADVDAAAEYFEQAEIFVPQQYIREHENDAPFADWVQQGLLLPSPGDVIDIGFEYATFGEIHSNFNVLALAYDPNRAEEITQLIEQGAIGKQGEKLSEGYGVQRIPVGTTSGLMASAVDEFEAFIRDGRVRHPGHAVLDWMFGNVQSFDRGDRTLLAKPKKTDTKKIDAVTGAVVAFAVARNPQFRPQRSVYEDRGVLFV